MYSKPWSASAAARPSSAAPGNFWEGDITAFAEDRPLLVDGQEFRTLEALFLHLTGERYAEVGWLWAPKLASLPR